MLQRGPLMFWCVWQCGGGQKLRCFPWPVGLPQPLRCCLVRNVAGLRACGGQSGSQRLEGGPSDFPQHWGGEQTTQRLGAGVLGPHGPLLLFWSVAPLGSLSMIVPGTERALDDDGLCGERGLGPIPFTTPPTLVCPVPAEGSGFTRAFHLRAFIYGPHAPQMLSYFAFCQ